MQNIKSENSSQRSSHFLPAHQSSPLSLMSYRGFWPLQFSCYLTTARATKSSSVGMFYSPAFSVLTERIKDYIAAGVSVEEKMIKVQNSFLIKKPPPPKMKKKLYSAVLLSTCSNLIENICKACKYVSENK